MTITRIPLNVVTLDGAVTEGVIVGVMVTELDALEAEVERWKRLAEEGALSSIEARNPGIDMDEVRRIGGYHGANTHAPDIAAPSPTQSGRTSTGEAS